MARLSGSRLWCDFVLLVVSAVVMKLVMSRWQFCTGASNVRGHNSYAPKPLMIDDEKVKLFLEVIK